MGLLKLVKNATLLLLVFVSFGIIFNYVVREELVEITKFEKRLEKLNQKLMNDVDDSSIKENATLLTLAKNSELFEIVKMVLNYESKFNGKYRYPWVFLNNEPFSETFKNTIARLTSGPVYFGEIPREQWDMPDSIDTERAEASWGSMAMRGIIYGGKKSYRQMCRYYSGFFWKHPLLDSYKYYWRVEHDSNLLCDIRKDPFTELRQRNKTYGFVITIKEIAATIPSLWNTTMEFVETYPELLAPNNLWDWISKDQGKDYSLCHFWSNFEIADLDFFRSDAYQKYFDYLDNSGGFFYERWGDAPIHSIALSLFLDKNQIYFFKDIGYEHSPIVYCPDNNKHCSCDTAYGDLEDPNSCIFKYLQVAGEF
ncbi:alpha-1,2-mannosyltransferase [Schizosaccharomyces cryophilus OY26]|uniref:Alpha-1,2-mannosyltransferase n=1 Tax=Schizosaccharomyces cryophilus (strain OY26 / ATCC MYA-4695 / CBS 11777 / NBRC 106824 / NRRL Y48691) TaxID=653667 RepID=S9W8N3_SCHCR|nr:alpha-1,2-mannosyltransferase [Schizosaccharomyces cryophilus OY26]EPY54250.1 alpha-1,2-mannosyltransferase [Schizosaccharomyces cryophilus OY26]